MGKNFFDLTKNLPPWGEHYFENYLVMGLGRYWQTVHPERSYLSEESFECLDKCGAVLSVHYAGGISFLPSNYSEYPHFRLEAPANYDKQKLHVAFNDESFEGLMEHLEDIRRARKFRKNIFKDFLLYSLEISYGNASKEADNNFKFMPRFANNGLDYILIKCSEKIQKIELLAKPKQYRDGLGIVHFEDKNHRHFDDYDEDHKKAPPDLLEWCKKMCQLNSVEHSTLTCSNLDFRKAGKQLKI